MPAKSIEEEAQEIAIKIRVDGWERGKKQRETPYDYTLSDQRPLDQATAAITELVRRGQREAVTTLADQINYLARVSDMPAREVADLVNRAWTKTVDVYVPLLHPSNSQTGEE